MTTYLEFNWHQFDSIFEAMTVVLMISKLNASDFFSDEYNDSEWRVQKFFFAFFAWQFSKNVLFTYQTVPLPQNICYFVDCSLIFEYATVFKWLIFVLLVCYLLDVKMATITLLLSILLCFLGVVEEGNGFQARSELMAVVFFAQFLAYSKYFDQKKIAQNRVQFSVQVIAAAYFLSALAKIQDSRLMWIFDAQYLPVQILKSVHFNEVTNPDSAEWCRQVAEWMLLHPYIVTFLISSAFFFEVFVFIAIFSKRNAFVWGVLLISMHVGISYTMDIVLKYIAYPMGIFFSNIFYFVGLIIFSILVLFKNALLYLFWETKALVTRN